MKLIATSLFALLLLSACNGDAPAPEGEPTAPAPTADAAVADAATQTQAIYGDEAPVAIEAEAEPAHADGEDHAHNPDGSHAEEAEAEDAHDHGDGSEPHAH